MKCFFELMWEVFGFIFDVGVQVEAQLHAFMNILILSIWEFKLNTLPSISAFWTTSRAHTHYFKDAVKRFRCELTFACPLPPCVFLEKDSPRNRHLFIVPHGREIEGWGGYCNLFLICLRCLSFIFPCLDFGFVTRFVFWDVLCE